MALTVKSQSHKNALLLGVGYTAKALIAPLKAQGYHVYGTTRRVDALPDMAARLGIEMIPFDGLDTVALQPYLKHMDAMVISVPPKEGTDMMGAKLSPFCDRLSWAGYLSATSVYGDRQGKWVFEDEVLRPTLNRGRARVEAELAWLETGLPIHIFRLAGIYGPNFFGTSRNPFAKILEGSARAVIKPGHVVNRIHVDDIAAAVTASMARPNPARVYNVSDGNPAPPQDVLQYAADLAGRPPVPEVSLDDADMSTMARSFYEETKRVSNQRLREELSWTPSFPDYKTGLMSIWNR